MIVLALDTSTWWASVAVVADGAVLAAERERTHGSHAIELLPLVERTLAAAGVALADVGAVAVTRGPGSFTGLRVGLSTAKGLAYATGARLVAVPTLEALALAVEGATGTVLVLLDARKGELYAGRFTADGAGGLRRREADRLVTIEAVTATLPERGVVVGDAGEAYGDALRRHAGPQLVLRDVAELAPVAIAVARLAATRLATGGGDEAMAVEPDYIRPSEAELNAVSA